jgi:hypothetical protein
LVLNTTGGPKPRGVENQHRYVNTSRVMEEDLVYEDEAPEIIAVVSAAGWCTVLEAEGDIRRIVPLVAWVASDSGRMYGLALGETGRLEVIDNDVEKRDGFVGYEQANTK